MEMETNNPSQEQGSTENDVVSDEKGKDSRKPKGGLITMPFIIANESFEKVASYGLLPNMIFYLMNEYNMAFARATNLLFYWSAATNFTPLLGAFVADSSLGRFLTIGLGSIASLLGMVLLWLTAMIPRTRPPPCDQLTQHHCKLASPGQLTLLISSFGLMSLGAGGVRPCSMAFGANQLDRGDKLNNDRVLERYFNWYYASASVSVLIAITAIVYIQDHKGWKVGFGVPSVLMLLSALMFFAASLLYVKPKASKSLLAGLFQVIIAACKNRRLEYPRNNDDRDAYYREKGSEYTSPTKKLRFLNKACMIKNANHNPPRQTSRWELCTINQVEELKSLIKVIPIWSAGIMISVNISQSSFPTLQASSMDRHVTHGFQIPAGSFGMFNIITLAVWVVLYDRAILPLASKIARQKVHLGVKLRMGLGVLLSFLAIVVSGIVEHVRRKKAIEQGLADKPHGIVSMSALWLVPQNCLLGLAEAFNAIGQTEFYYTELPKSMSSVAASLLGVGMGVANLLASAILSGVDSLSKRGGKESWVSSNINHGHYDYYYWILAALTFVDLVYFVFCSWAYGPCKKPRVTEIVGNDGLEEEKLPVVS